jgi:hypothetical protein
MPLRLRMLPTSNTQNRNPTYPEIASESSDFKDELSLSVAYMQQPKRMKPAKFLIRNARTEVGIMLRFFPLTTDGRLLGFDTGDWSMLLGGFVLAGLLTLFV